MVSPRGSGKTLTIQVPAKQAQEKDEIEKALRRISATAEAGARPQWPLAICVCTYVSVLCLYGTAAIERDAYETDRCVGTVRRCNLASWPEGRR